MTLNQLSESRQGRRNSLPSNMPSNMINLDRLKREVYCQNCKDTFISSLPAPVCELCGNLLIVVVKSMLTNQPITGEK